jgi:hypothetical protein
MYSRCSLSAGDSMAMVSLISFTLISRFSFSVFTILTTSLQNSFASCATRNRRLPYRNRYICTSNHRLSYPQPPHSVPATAIFVPATAAFRTCNRRLPYQQPTYLYQQRRLSYPQPPYLYQQPKPFVPATAALVTATAIFVPPTVAFRTSNRHICTSNPHICTSQHQARLARQDQPIPTSLHCERLEPATAMEGGGVGGLGAHLI